MNSLSIDNLDWVKTEGMIPAIVQDDSSGEILMLGFMNRKALETTLESKKVTFWSRTRNTLWTKGETSGNYLQFVGIATDCDRDTLLVKARPLGPVCHKGTATCFSEENSYQGVSFLSSLERLIAERRLNKPAGSYTTELFSRGVDQISQKLGEEAVELIISAHQDRSRTIEESADLLYHLLVFLAEREVSLKEVLEELIQRHKR